MSDHTLASKNKPGGPMRWRGMLTFLPVGFFILLALALGWGLTTDPKILPSTLIGKPVPEFNLPAVQGRSLGLSTVDLKGQVSLVNVFASWCTACKAEHPLFMKLKADKVVTVYGLNYKDRPQDAANWLDTLGDPYTRTGADQNGRVGIEWGVYGVPETFVISKDGRIKYKHIGQITPKVLEETLMPLIKRLRQE
jgi:cytochrome c biogenesis protein CcmG, thiol:disulfide interchange protein DsbE